MLSSKKKILILVGIYSTVIFLFFFILFIIPKLKRTTSYPTPIITPTPFPITTTIPLPSKTQSDFKGILPGTNSEEDVIETLGQPIKVEYKNKEKILVYPTKSEFLFDKIYINNNVKYVTQEVINDEVGKYDNFLKKFPSGPDGIVYEKDDRIYKWFVFPENGIAIFANDEGYITRVQYFEPRDFSEYLDTVAKDFSLSVAPPPPQP